MLLAMERICACHCRRPKLQTLTVVVGFTEVKLPATLSSHTGGRAERSLQFAQTTTGGALGSAPPFPASFATFEELSVECKTSICTQICSKYHANKYW